MIELKCTSIFYDCDGVLTNNKVLTDQNGKEAVFFNRSDGLAISEFRKLGIHQAIISTETNPVVERRGEKLRIPVIHGLDELSSNSRDKGSVLLEYAHENEIDLTKAMFIGNDINDLPALKIVGFPACPFDAEEEVISFVQESISKNGMGWVSKRNGGDGVIRELYRMFVLGIYG